MEPFHDCKGNSYNNSLRCRPTLLYLYFCSKEYFDVRIDMQCINRLAHTNVCVHCMWCVCVCVWHVWVCSVCVCVVCVCVCVCVYGMCVYCQEITALGMDLDFPLLISIFHIPFSFSMFSIARFSICPTQIDTISSNIPFPELSALIILLHIQQ